MERQIVVVVTNEVAKSSFFPTFKNHYYEPVLRFTEGLYSDKTIVPVDRTELALDGGH